MFQRMIAKSAGADTLEGRPIQADRLRRLHRWVLGSVGRHAKLSSLSLMLQMTSHPERVEVAKETVFAMKPFRMAPSVPLPPALTASCNSRRSKMSRSDQAFRSVHRVW